MIVAPTVQVAAPISAPPAAPDDALGRGVALRKGGHAAEAIAPLLTATRDHPADADAWLNLGLAYSATGALPEAEAALQTALRLSPDYRDVQIALARVAFYRGDLAEAERRLAPAAASPSPDPEVTDLVAQIARARSGLAHPWRLDLSASHASLSRGLPSSESASIFLGRTLPNKVSITAGFERVRQFNLQDTYYEVQIGAPGGYLAVGGAPNAHFRPKLSAHGGLEATPMPLGAGLSAKLGIDGGWSRYAVGDVWIANPFVTLLAGERLDLTARMINVIDETKTYRTGYGLAASWRPTPVLELSAGWIAAPESTDGVTVPVKATIVGLAWRVNDRLSLRLGGVREVRNAYTRNEITVGLTGRF